MGSGGIITARSTLWYLVFVGFAVNYMIRININIAIVAMVRKPVRTDMGHTSECFIQSNDTLMSNYSSHTFTSKNETKNNQEGTFLWNEKEQGLVLGAFFWFHWLTQVPGGVLAQKYGTKSVFGLSQLFSCLLSFVIPWSAHVHINVLLLVRFLQGLIAGLSWPSMHTMTAKWIPPNERSKFVTAYLGSSVGAALTFPMCGLIINWFNWEAVFHTSGAIGVAWFIAWWFLAFDSPGEHPRISEEEKSYIESSLGSSLAHEKVRTPWKQILLSAPVWMNILAQWGGIWGLFTLLTQSPTYFKYIHGWDIRMTGFLSGLPHLLRMTFAYFFSSIGDYLLKNKKMSRTNVRKMATAVCVLGQAVFTLALAFAGCDAITAVVLLTAATAIHGAVSTGPLASFVDLSPNFAGERFGGPLPFCTWFLAVHWPGPYLVTGQAQTIRTGGITLGLSGLVSVIPGFISPIVVGMLTYQNQTVSQWQIVFLISFGMLFITGILHLLFSRSEVQSWNEPEPAVSPDEVEKLNTQKREDKNKDQETHSVS